MEIDPQTADPNPKTLHHRDMIEGIQAIPKQEKFVTHSRDGTVRVWHAATLAHMRTLKVSESWVTDCKHFSLSNRLAASSIDRAISFYDATSYEMVAQLTGLDTSPMCLGYWQDLESEKMIVGDDLGNISLFDLVSERVGQDGGEAALSAAQHRLYRDRRHSDWVTKCCFYPELNFMVSSSLDGTLKIGDLERRSRHSRQLGEVDKHSAAKKGVYSFEWSNTFKVLASCGLERTVSIWNPYTRSGKPLALLQGHNSSVQHVTINEESSQLITCSIDKYVKVWDMRNFRCLQTIQDKASYRPEDRLSAIVYDPVRSQLLTASTSLRPWPMVKVAKRSVERGHEHPLCAALYNTNFHQVVSGDESAQVCVWDVETGDMVFHFTDLHSSKMSAMAFDEAGRRLITGGNDGTVRVWNFSNGQCLKELRNEGSSEVSSINFIVEGQSKLIVAGGWNRKVVVWRDDATSSSAFIEADRCMSGHQEDILSIAFSSEGGSNLLATSGYDGRVLVWNMDSGVVKFTLSIPGVSTMEVDQRAIYKLVFLDRRAQALCGSGADGYLRFWNVKEGESVWVQHAQHADGEAVVALATDPANRCLFTGDSAGFLKVWDISNFVNVGGIEQSRNVRSLHYWRAHCGTIASLDFVEKHNLILSASSDAHVKLWRVTPEGGRLAGILGSTPLKSWSLHDSDSFELVPQEPLTQRFAACGNVGDAAGVLPPPCATDGRLEQQKPAGAFQSAPNAAADAHGWEAKTDQRKGDDADSGASSSDDDNGDGIASGGSVRHMSTAHRRASGAARRTSVAEDRSNAILGDAGGKHSTPDLINQILSRSTRDPGLRSKVVPVPTMHRLRIHDLQDISTPRERSTPRQPRQDGSQTARF